VGSSLRFVVVGVACWVEGKERALLLRCAQALKLGTSELHHMCVLHFCMVCVSGGSSSWLGAQQQLAPAWLLAKHLHFAFSRVDFSSCRVPAMAHANKLLLPSIKPPPHALKQ
jgi:hypothetical protein